MGRCVGRGPTNLRLHESHGDAGSAGKRDAPLCGFLHHRAVDIRTGNAGAEHVERQHFEAQVVGAGAADARVHVLAYVDHARQKYNREPLSMDIAVDGDEVELSYDFGNVPFQRIRRITGYLVGTLDRFNNAKRAEEHDRVKHSVSSCCAMRQEHTA